MLTGINLNPQQLFQRIKAAAMSSAKAQTFDNISFKMAIPPGARKALTDYWGSEDILSRPEIIADIGADGVIRINRIGRKSLLQIARALDTFGYIDSSHLWLTKEKKMQP